MDGAICTVHGLVLNRHRDTSGKCWFSICIYYQKDCNDVAVCRVWSYGRSSMRQVSRIWRYGHFPHNPNKHLSWPLLPSTEPPQPHRPNPPPKITISWQNFQSTQTTSMIQTVPTTQNIHTIDFPCPLVRGPEKKNWLKGYVHNCKWIYQFLISMSFSWLRVRTHSSAQ